MGLKSEYILTEDGLRLQGMHYEVEKKDLCVLMVDGMAGFFIENYFADVLGETLAKDGVGAIYGHNRGYAHINDITIKKTGEDGGYKTKRVGATYERFEECIYDIDGWLRKTLKLGYKRVILMGHSLGCNKLIYYFYKKRPKDVVGIILASPPDMVGLAEVEKDNPNRKQLLNEARKNVKEKQPRKLLSSTLWDWYRLSSQTYLSLSEKGRPVDNLPVLRNPDKWPQLGIINVPILGIMGEKDDIEIRSLKNDLDLIASKAINAPSFNKKFVKGANHSYSRREKDLAKIVVNWIKKKY